MNSKKFESKSGKFGKNFSVLPTSKRVGFTLAEVLITLGIIGVVAAITLPTLVQNYKKQVYVNQLKKSVSTIEQGLKKMLADEGVDRLDQISDFEHNHWTDANTPIYTKYFNAVVAKSDSLYPDGYYLLNGEHENGNPAWERMYDNFYFNDGSLIMIAINSTYDGNAYWVVIDVNGDKKLPNKVGRDIFKFYILQNGSLGPNGLNYWENHSDYCGTPNSSTIPANTQGWGCAARIIENGWKMDY